MLMEYEKRFVFFIDILGFKAEIEKTKQDADRIRELLVALSAARGITSEVPDQILATKRRSHFSDSIVVSCKYDHVSDAFLLFSEVQRLIDYLLYMNLICRGGSAIGKLYHEDGILFGPAVIEAYEMESNSAFYPRIIIADQLIKDIKKLKDGSLKKMYEKHISQDNDGMYYIDYFKYASTNPDATKSLEILRSVISIGLEDSDHSVLVKYRWMCQKYNALVDEQNANDHNYPRINSGAQTDQDH